MDVPSPITAPSSTRAVGSIVLMEGAPSTKGRLYLLDFPVVSATSRRCPVTYGYRPLPPASVGEHRADVGLGHGLAVDDGVAVKPPHRLAPADAAHVIFDR